MLPLPAFAFTIPSIYDDTILDCRIYNPPSFTRTFSVSRASTAWRKKAAIVAHPYAPLGGCYDDPIVDMVASDLLMNDFVVCTFNFRGAGYSKARTSWTSKPETKDYVSLVGFMIYFMHHSSMPSIPPSGIQSHAGHEASNELTPIPSQTLPPIHVAKRVTGYQFFIDQSRDKCTQKNSNSNRANPVLLLAGYSYGALITTRLPNLSVIHPIFSVPEIGSAAAEIRIRAQQLAKQQNDVFTSIEASALAKSESAFYNGHSHSRGRSLHTALSGACSVTSSIRVGGGETSPGIRRASRDSIVRNSLSIDASEQIRKSIDKVRSLSQRRNNSPPFNSSQRHVSSPSKPPISLDGATSSSSLRTSASGVPTSLALPEKLPLLALDDLHPAYLLISPLQGLITSLATMWTFPPSSPPFPAPKHPPESISRTPPSLPVSPDHNLMINPTLAVFGTNDIFTSSKKLRAWAARLQSGGESCFRHLEVQGAGHFWHEEGAVGTMRRAVREFVSGL